MARRRRRRKLDELTVLPGGTLARAGAVPVRVTVRVVRADGGAPLLDLVHFRIRQRGLEHTWEPGPDARGAYAFEPGLLRPGPAWITVYRVCFGPVTVRARVRPNGTIRLGTVRLVLDRAAPGTVGVFLSSHENRYQYPVAIEELLLEGPAAVAGLREQDQLLRIDGQEVDVGNADRLVRGAPGTSFTVLVRRYLSEDPGTRRFVRPRRVTFSVVRAPGRPTRRRHPLWRA